MSKKIVKIGLILVCLVTILYSSSTLASHWREFYAKFFPCKKPIPYTISYFDNRFDLSREDFVKALKKAEEIWESPSGMNLFDYNETYKNGGILQVNLIYDSRQEATDKIEKLGVNVDNSKQSYDELKEKYDRLQSNFLEDKKSFENRNLAFSKRQEEYRIKVEEWNSKGGAPENVFNELNSEMEYLKTEYDYLKKQEEDLNSGIEEINSLVVVINKTAKNLNLNTTTLNKINKDRGEEFTQGEYKVGEDGQEINIYEFSTEQKLVTVLAHELGHALGIGHVLDEGAIMYRLNENEDGKLKEDDMLALSDMCK